MILWLRAARVVLDVVTGTTRFFTYFLTRLQIHGLRREIDQIAGLYRASAGFRTGLIVVVSLDVLGWL